MRNQFKQFNITSGSTQELIKASDYTNVPYSEYKFKVVIANNHTTNCKVSLYTQKVGSTDVNHYYIKNVLVPNGMSLVIKDFFYVNNGPVVLKSETGAIDVNMEIERE